MQIRLPPTNMTGWMRPLAHSSLSPFHRIKGILPSMCVALQYRLTCPAIHLPDTTSHTGSSAGQLQYRTVFHRSWKMTWEKGRKKTTQAVERHSPHKLKEKEQLLYRVLWKSICSVLIWQISRGTSFLASHKKSWLAVRTTPKNNHQKGATFSGGGV